MESLASSGSAELQASLAPPTRCVGMQLSGPPGPHGHAGSCSPRQFGGGEQLKQLQNMGGRAATLGRRHFSPWAGGTRGGPRPAWLAQNLAGAVRVTLVPSPSQGGLHGPPSLLLPHNLRPQPAPSPFPLCTAAFCSFLCWVGRFFGLHSHGGERPSLQWPFPLALPTESRGPLFMGPAVGLRPGRALPFPLPPPHWEGLGVGTEEAGEAATPGARMWGSSNHSPRALEVGGLKGWFYPTENRWPIHPTLPHP